MWNVIICLFVISAISAKPSGESSKCGYESCHPTKDGLINVHIVAHTHDDVGWLKTVDQYFYGAKTGIQKAGVQYILDSVFQALRADPNRRFIYVETSFFWKWWIKQHDFVKHHVKRFVKNGQLEFIGGGWSMNDEATTHYQSIIDQMTWGLRKLNDTFGVCGRPKIGWQIDPFGHSREMASIFSQLGYDGLLLGRIDYQDKSLRFTSKTPEMMWQASNSINSDIFTSVMFNTYSPPPGFCFDVLCDDEPIIDDKKSPDYNVDKRLKQLFKYLDHQTKAYATNNLIVTMGGDFTYMEANMWFKNLDKLIRYSNELQANGSKYNLLYSTPSCYLKAVQNASAATHINWSVKNDDFFPYSSDPHAFWTGYFTSKPTIKRYERLGNNFLQVCKQLYALTDLGPEDWIDLNVMREAMGVMQHHDAITGTEKEHVAHDYERILSKGFDECNFIAATALSKIVTGKKVIKDDPAPEIPFESCLLANISQCAFTESQQSFIVTVYNPLSRPVNQYVRLPIDTLKASVKDSNGKDVQVQIVPIPDAVLRIPGRQSKAGHELVFEAQKLPPLGFKSYYVTKIPGYAEIKSCDLDQFNNEKMSIKLDEASGLLKELTMNGNVVPLTQQFLYYRGAVGDNREFKNRSSGAYIFRPNGTAAYPIAEKATTTLYNGEHVAELHQTFSNWTSQVVRIYKSENYVEVAWLVGPIPDDEINGREVITRYTTKLKSEATFYTDSNGREILKRVRNFRPTWKIQLNEPIAGNYYPVTSKILIRDPSADLEFAVLTDRAQGGSSIHDGEIELMLHRKCLHDDAFGVDESLQEKAFGEGLVVAGTHWLVAGPYLKAQGLAAYERQLAQAKLLQAWTFLSPTNSLSFEEYKAKYKMEYSGLKNALPENVQILTLEPWKGMGFLIRFEHIMEKNEDVNLSKNVTIDLKNLFVPFEIKWFKETTLGANQWLDEVDRLKFNKGNNQEDILDYYNYNLNSEEVFAKKKWKQSQFESNNVRRHVPIYSSPKEDFKITLSPMQIRTFLIEIHEDSQK